MQRYYNLEILVFINTNTSRGAIRYRLQQPGKDRYLMFVDCDIRSLNQAELNYDIYNKELLAIIEVLKKQRVEL